MESVNKQLRALALKEYQKELAKIPAKIILSDVLRTIGRQSNRKFTLNIGYSSSLDLILSKSDDLCGMYYLTVELARGCGIWIGDYKVRACQDYVYITGLYKKESINIRLHLPADGQCRLVAVPETRTYETTTTMVVC